MKSPLVIFYWEQVIGIDSKAAVTLKLLISSHLIEVGYPAYIRVNCLYPRVIDADFTEELYLRDLNLNALKLMLGLPVD
jgi:hypothetical protein